MHAWGSMNLIVTQHILKEYSLPDLDRRWSEDHVAEYVDDYASYLYRRENVEIYKPNKTNNNKIS